MGPGYAAGDGVLSLGLPVGTSVDREGWVAEKGVGIGVSRVSRCRVPEQEATNRAKVNIKSCDLFIDPLFAYKDTPKLCNGLR